MNIGKSLEEDLFIINRNITRDKRKIQMNDILENDPEANVSFDEINLEDAKMIRKIIIATIKLCKVESDQKPLKQMDVSIADALNTMLSCRTGASRHSALQLTVGNEA